MLQPFARRRTGLAQRLGRLVRLARGRGLPLVAAALAFYATLTVVPLLYLAGWFSSLVLGTGRFDRAVREATVLLGAESLTGPLLTAVRHATPGSLVAAVLISALYGEGFVRAARALSGDQWRGTAALRARLMMVPVLVLVAVLVAVGLSVLDAYTGGAPIRDVGVLDGYLTFLALWLGATLILAACYAAFGSAGAGVGPTLLAASGAGSWVAGSAIGYRLVTAAPLNFGGPFFGDARIGVAVLAVSWLYLSHLVIAAGRLALAVRAAPAAP